MDHASAPSPNRRPEAAVNHVTPHIVNPKPKQVLARKWHPDKARGNKSRAVRKMREVQPASERSSIAPVPPVACFTVQQGGDNFDGFNDFRTENSSTRGQNLSLTVICVPNSLDSGAENQQEGGVLALGGAPAGSRHRM